MRNLPTPEPSEDGSYRFEHYFDEDDERDSVTLSAVVDPVVEVDGVGTVNLPRWEDDLATLPLLPVPRFPLVGEPEAVSGVIDQQNGSLATTIRLDATAPEAGGCVTLTDAQDLAAESTPNELAVRVFDGDRRIDVGDDCAVELTAGEERTLTVEIDAGDQEFAQPDAFAGSLSFRSVSAVDESEAQDFENIEIRAEVLPRESTSVSTTKVALLVGLAIALPLLLLVGANLLRRTVELRGSGQRAVIPVTFAAGRLNRRGDDGTTLPLSLTDRDMAIDVPMAGKARKVGIGSAMFRAHLPRNPFGDVNFDIEVPGAELVIGAEGTIANGRRGVFGGVLTPSSNESWVFYADERPIRRDSEIEPVNGSLLLLTHQTPQQAMTALTQALPRIESEIGRAIQRLAIAPKGDAQPATR